MIGYRKRLRVARGVSLNFSTRGVGLSGGPRHARIGIGRRGLTFGLSLLGAFYRRALR